MTNIAILSASRGVTLIKRFKKNLANNGGGKVYALDVSTDRPAMLFADEMIVCPYVGSENYDEFILNFCKEHSIDLLLSCRDEDLIELARLKKEINAIGTLVMVASDETIRLCHEKKLFNEFCKKNHFSIPKVFDAQSKISFPVFLKPNVGKGSTNTFKVLNAQMLESILANYEEDFIVQEFLDSTEYSVDLFADFNGEVISVVPRHRVLTVAGESYIGKTVKNKKIIEESIRLSKTLKLVGHNTLQCFFDGEIVKWIEVNPRFGGAANLGFESGHDTTEYLVSILRGDKVTPKVGEFDSGLKMLRYTNDVFKSEDKAKPKNKIFCIDIDGTICTEGCPYENAKPITKVVNKINELYNENTIILYTARGASSGFDWKPLTEKQLNEWGVKYHSLLMGKPYADYYIDNKAIDVLDWI